MRKWKFVSVLHSQIRCHFHSVSAQPWRRTHARTMVPNLIWKHRGIFWRMGGSSFSEPRSEYSQRPRSGKREIFFKITKYKDRAQRFLFKYKIQRKCMRAPSQTQNTKHKDQVRGHLLHFQPWRQHDLSLKCEVLRHRVESGWPLCGAQGRRGLHLHRLQDGRHHRHPDPGEHGEPRRGRWRPNGRNAQVSIQSPHLLVANYQLKPGQKYILWILIRLPISSEKEHVPNKRALVHFLVFCVRCCQFFLFWSIKIFGALGIYKLS